MTVSIAIGVPLVEVVYARFMEAWADMELPPPSVVPRKFVIGSVVHDAHNKIVEWFLEETDKARLLLLEHDHRFPRNLLDRVDNYTDPVVGSMYYLRYEPFRPCCFVPNPYWGEDKQNLFNDPEIWKGEGWEGNRITTIWPSLEEQFHKDGGLQRVSVVGMGCTSIRRDVLERWPAGKPYFLERHDDGSPTTDDVYFCRNAQRHGYGVYLDSGVEVPHMALTEVTRETYRANLRRMAARQGLPIAR